MFDDFVNNSTLTATTTTDHKLSPFNNNDRHSHEYTFHIKTYGCQMNVSDSDVVRAILLQEGFQPAAASPTTTSNEDIVTADVLLTNTCAIREKAESKVWQRLHELRKHKSPHQVVGILGCMAERLQDKLLEEGMCDIVVGPDQYRQLPDLIRPVLEAKKQKQQSRRQRQHQNQVNDLIAKPEHSGPSIQPASLAINVEFSLEETYDDIIPVRDEAASPHSAFVSIQRGCSNRCSFCIVPFTRGGQERSRSHRSIVDEIRQLVETQNLKEVVLLGQNVNSYHDRSASALEERPNSLTLSLSNDGFKSRWKRPTAGGYRFIDLVESVSDISPELRVRFTSPHPKDYPQELLQLMAERPNVCSQLHMPAQSGSTSMLKRMKRGYTREAYLDLMESVKTTIPDVALSSDFIAGFCDETEDEHADTVSLLKLVEYDQAFLFAYSMREKTHANRTMDDNVPAQIKQRRLQELIDTFRQTVHAKNQRDEVGKFRLVLVEGPTKKYLQQKHRPDSCDVVPMWHGRTDQNKRILFSVDEVDTGYGRTDQDMIAAALNESVALQQLLSPEPYQNTAGAAAATTIVPGDYAVVRVTEAKGHTLRGDLLWKTTLSQFAEFHTNYMASRLILPEKADTFHANLSRVWETVQGHPESNSLVV